ncbi:MAG: ABC transporter permease [Polyangiaceae bacterium]
MSVLSIVEQTVRIAVPFLFAASGGVLAERAGVVSLALEGYMLSGAFTAVVGAQVTGSAWGGLVAGALGGLLLGGMHALGSLRFKAHQIIMGIALNLFALGGTALFLKLLYDSSSNSPRVVGFGGDGASTWANPLLWLGLLSAPMLAWLIARTPWGLRVRAVGEHPEAAASVGVNVVAVRTIAVLGSSVLAALGGVYLALEQHQFTARMTAGRGFIALAAVIVGGWRAPRAGLACLFFAAMETLQIQLQELQVIPSQFLSMLPYALTILATLGLVGRADPPASLGK